MKKLILSLVLLLPLTGPVIAANATPESAATAIPKAAQPVERLQARLMADMKAGRSLDYKARYDKLKPVVDKSFDFQFIARMVLGSDWRKLNKKQREKFVAKLGKLSASSYAKEFNSYSGEHFDFIGSRAVGSGWLVRYALKTGDGKTVHFDYQMVKSGGNWKIANVIVNGVSDLALKRGQYRKLFSERGYSGLIAWIDKQIAGNAS